MEKVGNNDLAFCSLLIRYGHDSAFTAADVRKNLRLPNGNVGNLLVRYTSSSRITRFDDSYETYACLDGPKPIPYYIATESGLEFALDAVSGFFLPKPFRNLSYFKIRDMH